VAAYREVADRSLQEDCTIRPLFLAIVVSISTLFCPNSTDRRARFQGPLRLLETCGEASTAGSIPSRLPFPIDIGRNVADVSRARLLLRSTLSRNRKTPLFVIQPQILSFFFLLSARACYLRRASLRRRRPKPFPDGPFCNGILSHLLR